MRYTAIVCALGVLGIVCPCAGGAYLETYTQSIPATASFPVDGFVAVSQFNPSTGPHAPRTLLSVELELTLNFSGRMQFENTDWDYATGFLLQLTWNADLKRPDPNAAQPVIIHLTAMRSRNGTVDSFDGQVDYGGASGVTYDVTHPAVTGTATLATGSDLAYFTGTGSVNIPLSGSHLFVAQAPASNSYVAQATDVRIASGTLNVTYAYIPEPGAVLVFAFGPLLRLQRR